MVGWGAGGRNEDGAIAMCLEKLYLLAPADNKKDNFNALVPGIKNYVRGTKIMSTG